MRERDIEALEAIESEAQNALLAGDAESLVGLYRDDAVLMPPGAPAVEGRDALLEFAASFPPVEKIRLRTQATEGEGDLAYVWGTYEMTVDLGDEPPAEETGTYLTVFRREADGEWKIVADTWNSN